MLEYKKNYELFIFKNNQFIKVKPVIFKNKDNTFDFQEYHPCIVGKIDGTILQTKSSQNLYTNDKELLLCQ